MVNTLPHRWTTGAASTNQSRAAPEEEGGPQRPPKEEEMTNSTANQGAGKVASRQEGCVPSPPCRLELFSPSPFPPCGRCCCPLFMAGVAFSFFLFGWWCFPPSSLSDGATYPFALVHGAALRHAAFRTFNDSVLSATFNDFSLHRFLTRTTLF